MSGCVLTFWKFFASWLRETMQVLKYCPEVLLLGMAHINTASNLLQQEVSSAVIPILLQNADASGMIVHLWHVNPNILLRGLVDAMSTDPENMS
uniref:Ccr4-not transcription complex n=1 Tax=Solanum tuberosum TaxID=4113 RepID=M0ZG76_SOLTU